MLEEVDSLEIFNVNLKRSKALIDAIDKIHDIQKIYKLNVLTEGLSLKNIKLRVNKNELNSMEISCAEHAIISICTAFETYYKALLRQLMSMFPEYFITKNSSKGKVVKEIIESGKNINEEKIEKKLKLSDRLSYFRFFKKMEIQLFNKEEIEYFTELYKKRNDLVHTGHLSIQRINIENSTLIHKTEAKQHYNKTKEIINNRHQIIIEDLKRWNSKS